MLVDDLLPTYDVSDSIALLVDAEVMTTWDAPVRVDLKDVGRKRPMVAVLGALRFTGVMRTATTDELARRWFRRYWTFGVGSGAHVLVSGLLELARELAEGRP
jgi:hypothetical protein